MANPLGGNLSMSGVEHQIAIEVRDVVKRFGDHAVASIRYPFV